MQPMLPAAAGPQASTPTSTKGLLAGCSAAFGVFLLLLSLCGGIAYLFVPLQRARNTLSDNTLIGSLAAIGMVFGVLALLLGLTVFFGRRAPRLRLPPPWVFVSLFFIVVGIGQAVLSANLAPAYLFPPWHILASLMLPLAVLAYASRRLPPVTTSSVAAEAAWGGIGGPLLALVIELIAGIFVVLLAAVALVVLLGPDRLQSTINRLSLIVEGGGDPAQALSLLTQQPLLLVIMFLGVILMMVFLVPLIEETLKSIGPAIAIGALHPGITGALMWGLAAGAGFAFSENLLNGMLGITPGPAGSTQWALPMLLRGGTSLVHMAATATVSLGWYAFLVEHRGRQFLLFAIAGVAAHGLWNMLSLILGAALAGAGMGDSLVGSAANPDAILALVVLIVLVLLLAAAGVWIVWLVRWANRVEAQGAAATPGEKAKAEAAAL